MVPRITPHLEWQLVGDTLAAVSEAAAGLVLLVYPPIVVHLLFGAEITSAGIVMSQLAGISLIALGIACWPGKAHRALYGMLTYSTLAMLYLAYLGVVGVAGILLWPAVAVHAGLSILLVRARRTPD
jgi:hypothetical protein